jgi:hypothetical protein
LTLVPVSLTILICTRIFLKSITPVSIGPTTIHQPGGRYKFGLMAVDRKFPAPLSSDSINKPGKFAYRIQELY